ncbi:MAG: alpha/beta hydrolase [Clostridia bacterium]|nr:alpha/beta hydrolase [Clostridia bacterium]
MAKKHLFRVQKVWIPVGQHRIRLLILRPLESPGKKVPGVLWIHGGGYQSGSARDVFVTRALSLVVKFGAVLIAPNYRLSRHHPYPAALYDCYAALLYVRDHAEELGIREDQIMVGGESAGGGMAAALCMLAKDRGTVSIAFQMPLYPMLDDRDTASSADNHAPNWNTKRNHKAWKRYLRHAYGTDIVPAYAAPARRRDVRGLPPCYTFVGDIEPFYQETVDFVRRLQEAGVDARVDVYPNWFHAYDLFFPTRKIVHEAIAAFEAQYQYATEHYFAPQPARRAGEDGADSSSSPADRGDSSSVVTDSKNRPPVCQSCATPEAEEILSSSSPR